jgi:hypothetical protein
MQSPFDSSFQKEPWDAREILTGWYDSNKLLIQKAIFAQTYLHSI